MKKIIKLTIRDQTIIIKTKAKTSLELYYNSEYYIKNKKVKNNFQPNF